MSTTKKQALKYHSQWPPGKLEVVASKPILRHHHMRLAYAPGAREVARLLSQEPDAVYDYTTKGNLVAVISDGSAVLGLGNIGALASKPVMEGKGMLFKRFAAIDVFDLEIGTQDPELFIRTVKLVGSTFGGINLEDIKAPQCFEIEQKLKEALPIPVFHDDQHGTAIIAGSALLNALEIVGKDIGEVRVVFSGAGAAGFACAKYFVTMGVKKEHLILTDIDGVIYKGRGDDNYLDELAADTPHRTLAEAMVGADVFMGVSAAGVLKPEMVKSMAPDPIIFAMANPVPEIEYHLALETRPDAIMATGRSDYPNQINNVLGFPFIFRGALDVRATTINEEMKMAATRALAELAKEEVPDDVLRAYGKKELHFGREYIIPKPFDVRVLYKVAPAVAKAAMDSGVARLTIDDLEAYRARLERMIYPTREVVQRMISQATRTPDMRIVFPEGDDPKILGACRRLIEGGIAFPVLLGSPIDIHAALNRLGLRFPEGSFQIINNYRDANIPARYIEAYAALRERKGGTLQSARHKLKDRQQFAMMMVHLGDAAGCVSGITYSYPETIRPALELIGLADGVKRVCGMYMLMDKKGNARFFADTTMNIDPSSHELAQIAVVTSDWVKRLGVKPRVAMLSFSNFGSARYASSEKVRRAVQLAKDMRPELTIEGEMRVDIAVSPETHKEEFPFCTLDQEANVFIFPNLNAGNIGLQLMQYLGEMEAIGPILLGLNKPVTALPLDCDINTVVSLTAITAVMAKVGTEA